MSMTWVMYLPYWIFAIFLNLFYMAANSMVNLSMRGMEKANQMYENLEKKYHPERVETK